MVLQQRHSCSGGGAAASSDEGSLLYDNVTHAGTVQKNTTMCLSISGTAQVLVSQTRDARDEAHKMSWDVRGSFSESPWIEHNATTATTVDKTPLEWGKSIIGAVIIYCFPLLLPGATELVLQRWLEITKTQNHYVNIDGNISRVLMQWSNGTSAG